MRAAEEPLIAEHEAVTRQGSGRGAQRKKGAGKAHRYVVMDYVTMRSYKRPTKSLPWVRFTLMTAIGVCSFLIAYAVDGGVHLGFVARRALVKAAGPWVLYPFSLVLIMVSMLLVHFTSGYVAGSGIPEMKSVMSGIHLHRFLAKRTFVAKAVGLVLCHVASLSIGREGPFVHLTCVAANALISLPFYRRFKDNGPRQLAVLAAACAAGVSATFGAPFGGLLFSIEVTGTYYMVGHLAQSLFADVVGAVLVHVAAFGGTAYLFSAQFEDIPLTGESSASLLLFTGLGAACGLLGAAFTLSLRRLLRLRRRYVGHSLARRTLAVVSVGLMITTIVFLGKENPDADSEGEALSHYLSLSHTELINLLLQPTPLTHVQTMGALLFLPVKILATLASLCLPVPTGLFTPVFAIGAALGRVFGEQLTTTLSKEVLPYAAGELAIVGAAALTSGVTATVSSAVVVLELTGQLHLRLPTVLAVLTAYTIGKRCGGSVYDHLIASNNLPFLPALKYTPGLDPIAKPGASYEGEVPKPVEFIYTPPVGPDEGEDDADDAAARRGGASSPASLPDSAAEGAGGRGIAVAAGLLRGGAASSSRRRRSASALPRYQHVCAKSVMVPRADLCVLTVRMSVREIVRALGKSGGAASARGSFRQLDVTEDPGSPTAARLRPITLGDEELPVVASTDARSPSYLQLRGSVHTRDVVAVVEAAGKLDPDAQIEFVADYTNPDAMLRTPGSSKAVLEEVPVDELNYGGEGGEGGSDAGRGASHATGPLARGGYRHANPAAGRGGYGSLAVGSPGGHAPPSPGAAGSGPPGAHLARRRSSALLASRLATARVSVFGAGDSPHAHAAPGSPARGSERRRGSDDGAVSGTVVMDSTPLRVPLWTPLSKIDLLFRMLRLNVAYVTHEDKVVGAVTRHALMVSPYYRHRR